MNLASFDLNLLLALEALLVERSATRAGKRVGLSQSAVSNALSRLRRVIGDPLFVRGGGTMTPTAVAFALASPLHAALEQLRGALAGPVSSEPARLSYRARFATTDYAEVVAIAPLLRALRTSAPDMSLECRRLRWAFEVPVAALEKGEIEFALGHFGYIPPGHGLRSASVMKDRWVGLADGKTARMTIARFASRPHVKVMYGGDGPGIIGDALRELGKERVTPVVTPHYATVPYFVKGTDLLGIIQQRLARIHAPRLGLTTLRLPIVLPAIETMLVWHERHDRNPPHAWLRGAIAALDRGKRTTRRAGSAG